MLPKKNCTVCSCDAMGKSLVKSHCYNTRNKTTPNLPFCNSNKYLNSVLCKGPKVLNELPYSVKSAKSISSFISCCKNAITCLY